MLTRGLQGLSFAFINVAGLSTLVHVSPDLTRDISRQEFFVGIALGISPPISGVFYTYLGFSSVFITLASGLAVLIVTVFVIARKGILIRPTSIPPHHQEHQHNHLDAAPKPSLVPPRGVILSAATVMCTFNSVGFLELGFAGHVKNLLGLNAIGAGLFFSK